MGDLYAGLSDGELAARFDQADGEALNVLCRRHYHAVFRFAYRLTQNVSGAEDCTQETFVRFIRSWSRWQDRTRGAGPWLATIVRHVVVDRWERDFRLTRISESLLKTPMEYGSHTAAPDTDAMHRENVAAVQRALDAIDPGCQELIELVFRDRLTHKEAAEKLGASHDAVKKRYQRCLKRLQADLGAGGWL